LKQTKQLFGEKQVAAYAGIIETGISMVADDPSRPASFERSDIRSGVRSFHLEHAAKKRHGASHLLYFIQAQGVDGDGEVIILRVLHESMEPKKRLVRALRREKGENRKQ
jgi:toxin ParE1/3/4